MSDVIFEKQLLTDDEYNLIESCLEKWLKIDDDKLIELCSIITNELQDKTKLKLFLSKYRNIMLNSCHKLDDNIILSGFIMYLVSFCLCVLFDGNINKIEIVLSLYNLIDHYFDDKEIPIEEKNNFYLIIQDLLNGEISFGSNEQSRKVIEVLKNIEHIPELLKLLTEEFLSKSDENIKDKYEHCINKGKNTMIVICKLLELNKCDDIYEVGSIFQLLDDLMDIEEDIENGLETLPVYIINKGNKLDYLVFHIIEKINNIDSNLNLLKPFMIYMCVNCLKETKITKKLFNMAKKYVNINNKKISNLLLDNLKKLLNVEY